MNELNFPTALEKAKSIAETTAEGRARTKALLATRPDKDGLLNIVSKLGPKIPALEAERKALSQPFYKAHRQINDVLKPVIREATAYYTEAKTRLAVIERAEQEAARKARQQAQEQNERQKMENERQLAEIQARKRGINDPDTLAQITAQERAKQEAIVETSKPPELPPEPKTTLTAHKMIDFTIDDFGKVPDEYKEIVRARVMNALKAGKEIPGITKTHKTINIRKAS